MKSEKLLPAATVLSLIILCYAASARLSGSRVHSALSSYAVSEDPVTASATVVDEHQADGIRVTKTVRQIDGEQVDDGPYISYYPNGKHRSKGNYAKGQRHGDWTFWSVDGGILAEQSYAKGRLHGRYVIYSPNGEKAVEGKMLRGEKDGQWTYFDFEGRRLQQGAYRNGTPVGEWNELDEAGKIVKTVDYRALNF